jgi:hypothetical protein
MRRCIGRAAPPAGSAPPLTARTGTLLARRDSLAAGAASCEVRLPRRCSTRTGAAVVAAGSIAPRGAEPAFAGLRSAAASAPRPASPACSLLAP